MTKDFGTMKTIRLRQPGGLDRLFVSHEKVRPPGRGEVLVRIRASSLNSHDHAVVTGRIPTADGRIPLHDGAGEVIEIGDDVDSLRRGDQVVGVFYPDWQDGPPLRGKTASLPGDRTDGFACQYVTAPAAAFTRAPHDYTVEESATLPCAGVTAWHALMVDGPVRPGETVLVQGSGGVSVFALQFAKAAGATLIATSSSDEKLERLGAIGADHLINYRRQPEWSAAIQDITNGQGVDHIVEVGGTETLQQSILACAVDGHIALVGGVSGRQVQIATTLLTRHHIRIQGLTVGSRRHQLDMIRAIEANGIHPVIDRRYPIDELADAFIHLESGRHFGKIGVDI